MDGEKCNTTEIDDQKNLSAKKVPLCDQLDFNFIPEIQEESEEEEGPPFTKQEKHSRTPSGTVLTDIVEDIRTIFDSANQKGKRKRSEESVYKATKVFTLSPECDSQLVSTLKLKTKAKRLANRSRSASPVLKRPDRQTHQRTLTQTTLTPDKFKTKVIDINTIKEPSREQLIEISQIMTRNKIESTSKEEMQSHHEDENSIEDDEDANKKMPVENDTDQSQLASEEEGMETSIPIIEDNEMNPEVLPITTVQLMFKEIKQEMSTLKQTVQDMEKKTSSKIDDAILNKCTKKVISDAKKELCIEGSSELKKVKEELKHEKFRNKALTNVVQRMSIELEDVKARLENVEVAGARKAITISGLEIQGNRDQVLDSLESFFEQQLASTVGVDDFFRLGKSESKVMVVYFQSSYDKRQVMRQKYLLKDFRSQGRKVYINDYTPQATQEKRMKELQIRQLNASSENPMKVSYIKGKMAFQGETYAPKIATPTPKDMVDLTPEEIDEILKTPIESASSKIQKDKSIFESYISSVSSVQEIRRLYVKMKLIQPLARHIICAFMIPGEPKAYNIGYCDDGEPGAGNVVLQFMRKNELYNRVIFVSRKYGGIRMGMDRFDCYVEAAQKVASENTQNKVLKSRQPITDTSQCKPYQMERQIRKEELAKEKEKEKNQDGKNSTERGGSTSRTNSYNKYRGNYNRLRQNDRRGSGFREANDWNYSSHQDWSNPKDQDYYSRRERSGSYYDPEGVQ